MIAKIDYNGKPLTVDLSKPIDISIPLVSGKDNVTAWFVNPPEFKPVVSQQFKGDVNLGGSVNFRNIFFNPHGHGTHTECVGHISKEFITVNKVLKSFYALAQIVTVNPVEINGNRIIRTDDLLKNLKHGVEAIIVRTEPNPNSKLHFQYSNTNPPFLEEGAGKALRENGIIHLLIDTPSVDKEKDNGVLINHHQFWDYPNSIDDKRTITELIFVPDNVGDGLYLLNLQIAPFENDASPSKPILYKILD